MKQIFNKEFQTALINSLKEAGVEQGKVYNIVREAYKKELKKEAIKKLEFVLKCLEEDEYVKIKKTLAFSGAGDECGQDNYYINFSDVTDCDDIMSVIECLKGNNNGTI